MKDMKFASKVVEQAKAWLGLNEADGSHKKIIDIYNSHKPLARGYKMKYTDSWCATFVSAVSIILGYTDIIPTECGCQKMIDLFKKLGCWVEDENRVPNAGDIIFYDWQDDGKGDNTGWSDHVGIVEEVKDGLITVIEGNYDNKVQRRNIRVNYKYIRGFAVPNYQEEEPVTVELDVLQKGSKGEQVKTLQRILHSMGYSLGTKNPIDGSFGSMTDAAVKKYKKKVGLPANSTVDQETWNKLLKG